MSHNEYLHNHCQSPSDLYSTLNLCITNLSVESLREWSFITGMGGGWEIKVGVLSASCCPTLLVHNVNNCRLKYENLAHIYYMLLFLLL